MGVVLSRGRLMALGFANFLGAFFGAVPTQIGLSRSLAVRMAIRDFGILKPSKSSDITKFHTILQDIHFHKPSQGFKYSLEYFSLFEMFREDPSNV